MMNIENSIDSGNPEAALPPGNTRPVCLFCGSTGMKGETYDVYYCPEARAWKVDDVFEVTGISCGDCGDEGYYHIHAPDNDLVDVDRDGAADFMAIQAWFPAEKAWHFVKYNGQKATSKDEFLKGEDLHDFVGAHVELILRVERAVDPVAIAS